jgi:FkbM family methyltransferase
MSYSPDLDTSERRSRRTAIYRFEMRIGLLPALRSLMSRTEALPLGLRTRLVSLFCSSEYSSSLPFEVDFFGLTYPGDLSCYLDWNVYFFGAYEKPTLFLLRSLLQQRHDPVFVDIGANEGQHTLFMAKWAHVHAFEPWDVARHSIMKKIERNGLTNITVHPLGLGERHEWLQFYAPLGSNRGTGSFDKSHAPKRNRSAGMLEIVNGDDYFLEKGISKIDVVKIDTEGWEAFVLRGLRQTLASAKPIVFLEMSESTLRTFDGLEGFRRCIPDCYEALYVHFGRRGVTYSRFNASRPGDVLLRPSVLRLPECDRV